MGQKLPNSDAMQFQDHWEEAVNVILLTQSTSPTTDCICDYEVLTVRGNANSPLHCSSYVLPGGQLDCSDFSSKWSNILDKFDINSNKINRLNGFVSKRPPIISDNLMLAQLRRCSSGCDEENFVNTDIGLRIAAIRHVFQQTGILLVEELCSRDISLDVINKWRKTVSERPENFLLLCDELSLRPNLWSLKEWWNWLTPTSVGSSPRFDTIYYICVVNNPMISDSQHWCSPPKLLNDRLFKDYFLSPPQIYELSRLLNFATLEEVNDFSIKRQKEGIDRWLPMLALYSDGAISSLPGDDLYPKVVELLATKPVRSYPQSLEEMREKTIHLNRIQLRGTDCEVVVNIEMPFKHIKPVSKYSDKELICAKL